MTRLFAGAATALLLLSASVAPAFAQASSAPSAVKAGTYAVEPNHTQVRFSVLHFGFSDYSGFLSDAAGSLQLDPAHPEAAKLQIELPLASVMTTSTKLDGELKDPDWFDTAKFPKAVFTSTKVEPKGDGKATVTGDLTLHGATHPLVLDVEFVGAGPNPMNKVETLGFRATGTLKRSDYGVTKYVPAVSDEVQIAIDGAFTLKP